MSVRARSVPDLECLKLSLTVPGRELVRDLHMSCGPSRVVAVLGRNGAGKSSVLHALAGLRPSAGEIRIRGRKMAEWPRRELALVVGLLPQASDDSFPGTVIETALIGRHPHVDFWRWETARDRRIASSCLASVGLSGMEERDIRSLSGGERRRLAVATILAQDPQVYLLDEPLQQLDPHHQLDVLRLLRSRARDGRTVIMSLHDAGMAARFADEALLLFGDGRWRHGPTDEVLNQENITALYGVPVREVCWPEGRTFVAVY